MKFIRRARSNPGIQKYALPRATLYSPPAHSTEECAAPKARLYGPQALPSNVAKMEEGVSDNVSPPKQPFLVYRPHRGTKSVHHLPLKTTMASTDMYESIPALLLGDDGTIEGHFSIPKDDSPENRMFHCSFHAITDRPVIRKYPVPIPDACPLPEIPLPLPPPSISWTSIPGTTQHSPTCSPRQVGSLKVSKMRPKTSKSFPNLQSCAETQPKKCQLKSANSIQDFRTRTDHHGANTARSLSASHKNEPNLGDIDLCMNLEMYKYVKEESRITEWRRAFSAFQRETIEPPCHLSSQTDLYTEEPPRLSSPFKLKEPVARFDPHLGPYSVSTNEADEVPWTKHDSVEGAQSHHDKRSKLRPKHNRLGWRWPNGIPSPAEIHGEPTTVGDTFASSQGSYATLAEPSGKSIPAIQSPWIHPNAPFYSTPSRPNHVDQESTSQPAKPRARLGRKMSSMSLSQACKDLADVSVRYIPSFARHQEPSQHPKSTRLPGIVKRS